MGLMPPARRPSATHAQLEFDFTARSAGDAVRRPLELRVGTPRRRNVEAVLEADRIVVTYPPRMNRAEAERIAEELRTKLERRTAAETIDLAERAATLARRHGLATPRSIAWSHRQQALWGVCTGDGDIRISTRLAELPRFVLDAVIVHELAHLCHLDHGPEFAALVGRYPKTERAMGYLMALDHHARPS
jgi:predicted metal-dependent hydrolase